MREKAQIVELILFSSVSFALGFLLSYLFQNKLPIIKNLPSAITFFVSTGIVVVLLQLFINWHNKPILRYEKIYKKSEERSIPGRWEGRRKIEGRTLTETSYYLRIIISNRKGKAKNCEGKLYVKESGIEFSTVWEGPQHSPYRDIGIYDDLKLFHISEDQTKLIFSTNPDNSTANYEIVDEEYNEMLLNKKLSIILSAEYGKCPKEPYVDTIRAITQKAVQRY